jgi:hypothetical protein
MVGSPLGYEGLPGRLAVKLRDAEKRDVARPRRKGQAACGERDMIIPRVREIEVRAGVQERAGVGSRPSRDVRAEQDIAGDLRAAHIEAEVLKVHVAVGWRRKRLSVCGSIRVAKRVSAVTVSVKIIVDSFGEGASGCRKSRARHQCSHEGLFSFHHLGFLSFWVTD